MLSQPLQMIPLLLLVHALKQLFKSQLMSKATIEQSAVLALQSKINSLRDDLSNARIDMALTASAVLTPEQREMFAKFGHGRGHGGAGEHK